MKLNILTNNIPVSIACKNIIDKWPVRTLISVSPLKGLLKRVTCRKPANQL